MPDLENLPPISSSVCPDYTGLVRFLINPFLDSPDALRIDSEISPRTSRVLIRLAIEGEDKGRVFGRGGRNIQAVRTALQVIAKVAGHSVHLEVFGGPPTERDGNSDDRQSSPRPQSRRPSRPQPR